MERLLYISMQTNIADVENFVVNCVPITNFQWLEHNYFPKYSHFVFCSGETASCLYNYPDDNKLLARELPGTMLTLDEQCERDRGTQACFVSNLYTNYSLEVCDYTIAKT